jgi:hypothetical protein
LAMSAAGNPSRSATRPATLRLSAIRLGSSIDKKEEVAPLTV